MIGNTRRRKSKKKDGGGIGRIHAAMLSAFLRFVELKGLQVRNRAEINDHFPRRWREESKLCRSCKKRKAEKNSLLCPLSAFGFPLLIETLAEDLCQESVS